VIVGFVAISCTCACISKINYEQSLVVQKNPRTLWHTFYRW